MLKFHNGGW